MSNGTISKISCDKVSGLSRKLASVRLTELLSAGEVLFADVLLLPNGMSKVGVYVQRWPMLSLFLLLGEMWVDGLGRCPW